MTASIQSIPHKAARVANYLRTLGALILTTTPPWTPMQCDTAIDRGPHQSSHGERQFVAEEMLDFCEQGYWRVVPYHEVRELPSLRISPLGVVPQRDRRPRLIVDYTFSDVNADTVPLAPAKQCSLVARSSVFCNPLYMLTIDTGPPTCRRSRSLTVSTVSGSRARMCQSLGWLCQFRQVILRWSHFPWHYPWAGLNPRPILQP